MRNLYPALLLTIVLPAGAADQPKITPPAPAPDQQVTIVKKGADTVEEYRTSGKLNMLKVTPAQGEPYLLIDEKGDGTLTRRKLP